MTFSMSFMPAFMLPMCRSVEIESGRKPCLDGWDRDPPEKAAAAVADVEDHAALAAFEQGRDSRGPGRSSSPRRPEYTCV